MWISLLSTILVINELMASNAGQHISPAVNFDSWIELYNPTDEAVNLSGMYLSNDPNELTRWQMPANMGSVPAKGFKVIWLGSNDIKDNQAPFKLDCDGGTVCLSDKNGQLIVQQTYPAALSRTAYARKTDGGEEWGWTANATPGESNATSVFADKRLDPPVVSVGSRLFTGTLDFEVDIPEGATLMYTTDGSLPAAPKPDEDEAASPWTEWVKNGDCEGSNADCFVSRDGDGNGDQNRIVDGIGYNGSRGIRVHAIAKPDNSWSTQFFVYTPDHTWKAGETYRFSMKVRADKATYISVQAHRTPGDYITYNMLNGSYNVGTEWTEIVYEGTVTNEQAGNQGGWGWGWGWGGQEATPTLQTIAFNLNEEAKENYFYFDDISWASGSGAAEEPTKKSADGKFSISKTTNFCFRLYQEGCLPSIPVTRSYIQTSNKYTIPIISIVGDKKYFTDPKIGIDTDGDGTNGKPGNGQDFPRNYNMDWDRPVNFSYLSPEGEMLFNQDVNISVSGGWTRSQRYRSFKLKSNKIFDGQNRFDFSFFPQKPYIRNKAILLRNGGNDLWQHNARFMDPALETIIQRSGIDLDVQSYVPIIEYVNGELRGVLNLREPNNDKFVYANFGYGDEDIDMFENFIMKNGNDQAIKRIFELGSHINEPGVYEELKELLDIDEFTNYMATELFLANDDWPDNNIKAYRSQNNGRYRFISFDLDYAFSLRGENTTDNPFTYFERFKNMEFVNFFLNLLGHDSYRRKFIDTFCLIGGSVFEPTRAGNIVDELLKHVQPMNQLMQQVMSQPDGNSPERAANTIKSKLKDRTTKMSNYMQAYKPMQLGSAKKLAVKLSADTEQAKLYVNGLEVPYANFTGQLFAPITLEAKAPAGYVFEGWKQGSVTVSTNSVYELPDESGLVLTACFTPLSEQERQQQGLTPVRINEISAANDIFVNEHFKRNDWIELYNTTDEPIDVEGMYLTDNLKKPEKYQITKGQGQASTVIPAHGYLIIWCDNLEAQSQLHASFKLAQEGGEVMLTATDGSWNDCIIYTRHTGDQSVGRYPDGGAEVYVMNVPTIAKANLTSSYLQAVEQDETVGIRRPTAEGQAAFSVRYVLDNLIVRGAADGIVEADLYNMAGQHIGHRRATAQSGYAEMPVGQLGSGIYVARITDAQGHTANYKFVKK